MTDAIKKGEWSYKVYVDRPIHIDSLEVRIVRYGYRIDTIEDVNGKRTLATPIAERAYPDEFGQLQWTEYEQLDVVPPTLSVPGLLGVQFIGAVMGADNNVLSRLDRIEQIMGQIQLGATIVTHSILGQLDEEGKEEGAGSAD